MQSKETIADYYQHYGWRWPEAGQVGVYQIEAAASPATFPHIRRDFYKVKLLTEAHGIVGYADKSVVVEGSALIFVNPLIPYSWQRLSGHETGFVCLFTEEFSTAQFRTAGLASSPLFRVGGTPVLFPTPEVTSRLRYLFEQLLAETQTTYAHKYDLLRNYLQIILHESLKIAPAAPDYQAGTSAARLSGLFLELLERQFPMASPQHTLALRNANEFARQLAVHTNHLNKALKEVTGKTTTEHIATRLVDEAKALLRHSNWSVAEVGYCLGFEHAANFHNFFKRHTGQAPTHYRRVPGVLSYVLD